MQGVGANNFDYKEILFPFNGKLSAFVTLDRFQDLWPNFLKGRKAAFALLCLGYSAYYI